METIMEKHRLDVSEYRPGTAADAFRRLLGGTDAWVALGDFLDDWYVRAITNEVRRAMVKDELPDARTEDEIRWAAFFAATVHRLCDAYKMPPPEWVRHNRYVLQQPWFLFPGTSLRAWQLFESPPEFKMRNVFAGDNVLSRA